MLDGGNKPYKLPGEIHENIFNDLLEEMFRYSAAQEKPRIVILGGQPGSGKSCLIELARKDIFDNQPVAVINGDDYRAYHPNAKEIYKEHDKAFAEMTDPDVRIWTARLLDAAINGKRNIIFEATMRNKEPLMSTIKYLKDEGYRIDVMVMAVNDRLSRAGILKRYEDKKSTGEIARWTPFDAHDEAYGNMPDTVEAIEERSPIDSIRVYNRASELLYGSEREDGVFKRDMPWLNAKAAILEERDRSLSASEEKHLQASIKDIQKMMENRGAGKDFKEIITELSAYRGFER
jgi:predicted ABC-type ATPase